MNIKLTWVLSSIERLILLSLWDGFNNSTCLSNNLHASNLFWASISLSVLLNINVHSLTSIIIEETEGGKISMKFSGKVSI